MSTYMLSHLWIELADGHGTAFVRTQTLTLTISALNKRHMKKITRKATAEKRIYVVIFYR